MDEHENWRKSTKYEEYENLKAGSWGAGPARESCVADLQVATKQVRRDVMGRNMRTEGHGVC